MKSRLPLLSTAAAVLLLGAATAIAVRPEDVLQGVAPVPAEVSRSVDVGRLDGDVRFTRAILVLPARDRARLERFLESQQDPSSPDFRRWITPEEFGRRFGAPEADVAALRAHLEANGLEVEDVPAGRTALLFSGRAADVERAFATELREVFVDGAIRVANVRPARLPAGLARRTAGLLSLNSFPRRRALARRTPAYTDGSGRHVLAPADFATIYGIDALAAAGINGTGRKIAILAQTNVTVADTRFFRQYFGLPANDPQVVLNGPDAGINGDEIEADLDIQWAGAVAPAAQVLLVVSKTTLPSYGVDLSALYAVNNDVADVLNLSYGACENDFADSDTIFYTNIWAQAAAQGTTSFVSSGDSGAAGCESQSATTGTVRSVNGLGSSPYATCVGGTQYLDTSAPSAYWSATNDPVTKRSAKGAIPEGAWNESGVGSGIAATGGGLSVLFSRPPWQNVAGVPAGTGRAVPDVSVAGAGHTPYFIVMGGSGSASGLARVYGTSASAPAFAGIAALLSQRAGSRLGNLNPLLYALGQTQYGTSETATTGTGPFRDVTAGSNSVPGVTGYDAGPGYDAATGLGSPDVTALAAAIASPAVAGADLALSAAPAVASVQAGFAVTVTATLEQSAIAADAVATLTLAGLPAGLTASFSPSKMDEPGTGIVSRGQNALLTLAAAPGTAAGTYTLTLAAASGAAVRRISLFLTVGPQPATPASGPGVQAPVVLDVFGAGGSHYTSDLVAVNRGTSDATLLLRFAQTPAPATPGPTIARWLGAGRQFRVADVIAFLNANGYSLPSDGSAKLGTLFATFVGASDPLTIFVGSRTSTPNPNASVGGAFGTFSTASATGGAPSGDAWIYGLRENGQFRSNLALVHAPGAASGVAAGPVTLEVQIYDGDSGAPAGAPLTQVLQPGQFFQYNRVLTLAPTGVANGYARVRLTSGTDRFIAYGVLNDGAAAGGGTSDGSFLPANATEGLIPIILDLPGATHYTSDLTLTNPTSSAVAVTLTYTASTAFSGAGSGTKTATLAARQQLVVANAITYLRGLGLAIPATGNQGGTLLVSGAPALARTSNPNPDAAVGGTFGLAYPAVGASARAKGEAWVYGLRQDGDARTNLAIADARAGNTAGVEYTVDVFDADTGAAAPVLTKKVTLAGGQWTQFNTILVDTGIAHGFARIRPSSGTSDFVAYGVVNDGPTAGSRTSDGSYVPMVVVN
ncbi:MAG: S53 family peptidase [Acidobacteriota bacterium]